MQQLEEALTMLADRGEDLPIETVISRLETVLGALVEVPEVRSAVVDDAARTVEAGSRGALRRRAVRSAFAFAAAAAAVVVVVGGVVWLLAGGSGEPADVPPVNTTIVHDGFDAMLSVTFDGERCTVEGPNAIAARTVVPVVLTNTSTTPVDFHVARLVRDVVTGEERTFEDFVELQRASGGALREDHTKLIDSPINWLLEEPLSFDRSAYRLAPTLADDQVLKVYQLSPEVGTSIVYVTRMGPFDPESRINPETYWFCAPLEVTPVEL